MVKRISELKIVFVSRGWWPAIKGGSEKFMYKLAEVLSKRGYETYVVTREYPDLRKETLFNYLFVRHRIEYMPQ